MEATVPLYRSRKNASTKFPKATATQHTFGAQLNLAKISLRQEVFTDALWVIVTEAETADVLHQYSDRRAQAACGCKTCRATH